MQAWSVVVDLRTRRPIVSHAGEFGPRTACSVVVIWKVSQETFSLELPSFRQLERRRVGNSLSMQAVAHAAMKRSKINAGLHSI